MVPALIALKHLRGSKLGDRLTSQIVGDLLRVTLPEATLFPPPGSAPKQLEALAFATLAPQPKCFTPSPRTLYDRARLSAQGIRHGRLNQIGAAARLKVRSGTRLR